MLDDQEERYPQFLTFWKDEEITEDNKLSIFKTVVQKLMAREVDIDARVTNSFHKELQALNVNRSISAINN